MFDVGFWELSLLAVLGLLILGPDRLPRVVHTAGLWLGRARGAMRKLQREVQRELMIEETRAAVEKARRTFETTEPEPSIAPATKPVSTEASDHPGPSRDQIGVADPVVTSRPGSEPKTGVSSRPEPATRKPDVDPG